MDVFVLVAFASLAAKNSLGMIASLPELYFRFRRFILLVQTEKSDFYELAAPLADENHKDEKSLT